MSDDSSKTKSFKKALKRVKKFFKAINWNTVASISTAIALIGIFWGNCQTQTQIEIQQDQFDVARKSELLRIIYDESNDFNVNLKVSLIEEYIDIEKKLMGNDIKFIKLKGLDLSNSTIENIDFFGIDFSNTNFEKSTIKNCTFIKCYLQSTNFSNSRIINSIFDSCNLLNSDHHNVILDSVKHLPPEIFASTTGTIKINQFDNESLTRIAQKNPYRFSNEFMTTNKLNIFGVSNQMTFGYDFSKSEVYVTPYTLTFNDYHNIKSCLNTGKDYHIFYQAFYKKDSASICAEYQFKISYNKSEGWKINLINIGDYQSLIINYDYDNQTLLVQNDIQGNYKSFDNKSPSVTFLNIPGAPPYSTFNERNPILLSLDDLKLRELKENHIHPFLIDMQLYPEKY